MQEDAGSDVSIKTVDTIAAAVSHLTRHTIDELVNTEYL